MTPFLETLEMIRPIHACAALAALVLSAAPIHGEGASFTVTVKEPMNGTLSFDPGLPEGGKVASGTTVRVTGTPAAGYAVDSVYYSVPGRWGPMYFESMVPTLEVTVDQDMTVGALFLPDAEFEGFTVTQDVVFAQPGVKPLKYDVFSPEGAENLPIVVIIHGGGWRANTEDIMRGMAREIVRTGKYVVFSVDYRWANKGDGDETGNTMADLINDVFGAVAHIQEHARQYGADPTRIAVTGDSAGGHLSAVVATMSDKIGDGGFGEKPGVFEFMPSYVPEGKTVAQVRQEISDAVQVAAPSYGVFAKLRHFSEDPGADDSWSAAVSPINHIPSADERKIPHYLVRGTQDPLIRDEMVRDYAEALEAKGQTAEYVQVEGASHAFFDWKPDQRTRDTFARIGVPYVKEMIAFFDAVFYPAS
jgi:acetyl esterase